MGKFKFQKDSKDNKKSNKISNHLHILNQMNFLFNKMNIVMQFQ